MNADPTARILIVDDEEANMRALCETLRDHGYETAGAASGEQALELFRRQQFDLLLTDLIMPSIDRKSTRLNSSHIQKSRMPSSA